MVWRRSDIPWPFYISSRTPLDQPTKKRPADDRSQLVVPHFVDAADDRESTPAELGRMHPQSY